jgi:hypothetical protein
MALHLQASSSALGCGFMKNKCIAFLLCSLVFIATNAHAKPGKGKKDDKEKRAEHAQNGNGHDNGKKSKDQQFARFKDDERGEIESYFSRYKDKDEGLPPGLAMNQRRGKPLPPGWQKKLVPGYRIDDVSWLGFAPVPAEWFPNVRMEPDTRLYHYGDRVVRVYEPRREVIDVIVL